ncbi:hypothetical protein FHG87_006317 [Trinorchestia longiramus]|nr:hypothetical protein FHG87_006317 [Trinorchestia longiramus]
MWLNLCGRFEVKKRSLESLLRTGLLKSWLETLLKSWLETLLESRLEALLESWTEPLLPLEPLLSEALLSESLLPLSESLLPLSESLLSLSESWASLSESLLPQSESLLSLPESLLFLPESWASLSESLLSLSESLLSKSLMESWTSTRLETTLLTKLVKARSPSEALPWTSTEVQNSDDRPTTDAETHGSRSNAIQRPSTNCQAAAKAWRAAKEPSRGAWKHQRNISVFYCKNHTHCLKFH